MIATFLPDLDHLYPIEISAVRILECPDREPRRAALREVRRQVAPHWNASLIGDAEPVASLQQLRRQVPAAEETEFQARPGRREGLASPQRTVNRIARVALRPDPGQIPGSRLELEAAEPESRIGTGEARDDSLLRRLASAQIRGPVTAGEIRLRAH